MAPPTKRRKRNVIPALPSSSEDEGPATQFKTQAMDNISSSPVPVDDRKKKPPAKAPTQSAATLSKPQTRAKTANFPSNAAPIHLPKQARGRVATKSMSSSPEKAKKKPIIEEKWKSGNISALFTKQAQRQKVEMDTGQPSSHSQPSRPRISTQPAADLSAEDFDGISDDDDVFKSLAPSSHIGTITKKRALGSQTFKNDEAAAPSSTQKFLSKPQVIAVKREEPKRQEDLRPWADRFAPVNLEELAVHVKKVADVRSWLEEVINGQSTQRILILKGSAGTGKTTTTRLLAEAMDCEVLEWRNPISSIATADGFQSMTAQFEEFLGRGGKFGQLDIFSTSEDIPSKPEVKPLDRRKRLILVEEFPNTFTRASTALQSWRSTILQYLASNTRSIATTFGTGSKEPVTPVVMIISETLLTTTSASADSFTAHRLLGPEIINHLGVKTIEFNPIAPTFLAKALELIVRKESRISGRKNTPGPRVLKTLGEIGDIRSATGSLEFLCLRGDTDGDWGAKIAFPTKSSKGSKVNKDLALTKMEQEGLELVTRREASLGIFHAVGKVVYNKREEVARSLPTGQNVEKLPDYLSLQTRSKRSEVMVDRLIDETGTDTQTFIAALHENYILSCDAHPTSFDMTTLDHVNGCIDALSDSDLLCPNWDGSFNSTGFGGGTGGRGSGGDILRQDEMTFQIAVRGLLFALPNPVIRQTPKAGAYRNGKSGDAHKMFYPTSLKLWRTREEIESSIDLWVTRLMKGDDQNLHSVTSGAAAFLRPKAGTVESWKGASSSSAPNTKKKEEETAALISVGTSARKEMVLERLPYMYLIAKPRKPSSATIAFRDLEKVVVFRGIGVPSEEEADAEDGVAGEEWATDKPGDGRSPKKKSMVMRGRGQGTGIPLQPEMKLVLSDDDIEDDD